MSYILDAGVHNVFLSWGWALGDMAGEIFLSL
jgi:hypothetical protein